MPALIAFRFANWDRPLWISPNRRSGRFNKPESPPTQYLCLHPLGPLAEYLRREGYTDLDRVLELKARVWVMRVTEPRVEELNFDTATRYGLEPADLIADDYGACQAFADRCRREPDMPEAIRVPSAALPGTDNLVIFGPRVLAPYNSKAIDQVDVPGSVVAEGSHPLHTLIDRVCYVGESHAQLEAWTKGEAWEFSEPSYELMASHYD